MAQEDNDPTEEEAGAEDISEYESVLIGAAMDLVGAMSNVFGQDFLDPLRALLPKVTKYYVSSIIPCACLETASEPLDHHSGSIAFHYGSWRRRCFPWGDYHWHERCHHTAYW